MHTNEPNCPCVGCWESRALLRALVLAAVFSVAAVALASAAGMARRIPWAPWGDAR
jgi:hypothetical protein